MAPKERPVGLIAPSIRSIKLYADGRIDYQGKSGSADRRHRPDREVWREAPAPGYTQGGAGGSTDRALRSLRPDPRTHSSSIGTPRSSWHRSMRCRARSMDLLRFPPNSLHRIRRRRSIRGCGLAARPPPQQAHTSQICGRWTCSSGRSNASESFATPGFSTRTSSKNRRQRSCAPSTTPECRLAAVSLPSRARSPATGMRSSRQ